MSAGALLGIAVCAVCAAVFGSVMKSRSREFSLLLSIGAAVLVAGAALKAAEPLMEQVLGLAEDGGLPGLCLTAMLKAAGLTVLGQLASRFCKDGGEAGLAYAVELAARVAVLAVAMPVLVELFARLGEILQL